MARQPRVWASALPSLRSCRGLPAACILSLLAPTPRHAPPSNKDPHRAYNLHLLHTPTGCSLVEGIGMFTSCAEEARPRPDRLAPVTAARPGSAESRSRSA